MVAQPSQLQGVICDRQVIVTLGVHLDETFGVGAAHGVAEGAVAGLDALARIGAAVALTDEGVQGCKFLLDHVGDVDEDVVVEATL